MSASDCSPSSVISLIRVETSSSSCLHKWAERDECFEETHRFFGKLFQSVLDSSFKVNRLGVVFHDVIMVSTIETSEPWRLIELNVRNLSNRDRLSSPMIYNCGCLPRKRWPTKLMPYASDSGLFSLASTILFLRRATSLSFWLATLLRSQHRIAETINHAWQSG